MMAADDLRERIERGELDALLDPALSLYLLADGPTAEWWQAGCVVLVYEFAKHYARGIPPKTLASAVDAWAAEHVPSLRSWSDWESRLEQIRVRTDDQDPLGAIVPLVLGELVSVAAPEENVGHLPASFSFLHRLRALLASAPPEVDAALEVLEKYVGA